jgi:hypothetical protein
MAHVKIHRITNATYPYEVFCIKCQRSVGRARNMEQACELRDGHEHEVAKVD